MSMMQMLLGAGGKVTYPDDTFWVKNMDRDGDPYNQTQVAKAIDSDNDGNIYLLGQRQNMSGWKVGMTVTKIDVDGDIVWQKGQISDPSNDWNLDVRFAIGVTPNGASIYSGCESEEGAIFTKWNSSGVVQWTKKLGGGSGNDGVQHIMPVGTDDAPVLWLKEASGGATTGKIMKMTNAGATTWQNYVNAGSSGNSGQLQTCQGTTDSSGNVYQTVHGSATDMGGSGSIRYSGIVKWDSDGDHQDTFVYQTSASGEDELINLTVDSSGNMYVIGKWQESGTTYYKSTLMKLNSSGVIQWQRHVTCSSDYTYSHQVHLTSNDEIIWMAREWNYGPYLFFRYQADGTLVWEREFNVGSEKMDGIGYMNLNRNDNILFCWNEAYSSGTDYTSYLAQLPGDGTLTGTHGSYGWQDTDSDISISTTSAWSVVSSGWTFPEGTSSLANADFSSSIQTVTNSIVEESLQAVD